MEQWVRLLRRGWSLLSSIGAMEWFTCSEKDLVLSAKLLLWPCEVSDQWQDIWFTEDICSQLPTLGTDTVWTQAAQQKSATISIVSAPEIDQSEQTSYRTYNSIASHWPQHSIVWTVGGKMEVVTWGEHANSTPGPSWMYPLSIKEMSCIFLHLAWLFTETPSEKIHNSQEVALK